MVIFKELWFQKYKLVLKQITLKNLLLFVPIIINTIMLVAPAQVVSSRKLWTLFILSKKHPNSLKSLQTVSVRYSLFLLTINWMHLYLMFTLRELKASQFITINQNHSIPNLAHLRNINLEMMKIKKIAKLVEILLHQ